MKTFITIASLALLAVGAFAQDSDSPEKAEEIAPIAELAPKTWVDDYEALLEKYVASTGVRYKAWHASAAGKKALADVITEIGKQSLTEKTREEKLAFYLNAYNAWILQRILAEYPTDGPGGGRYFGRNKFFKTENLKVAGKTTSFHVLENEIIRPTFKEPRIHFALNCASASCPPLHTKAFRGETLDETLDALTKAFVNTNTNGVNVTGKKIAISKIFDWYKDDFKAAGGALAYINKYRTEPAKGKVSFQKYHWTLNQAK